MVKAYTIYCFVARKWTKFQRILCHFYDSDSRCEKCSVMWMCTYYFSLYMMCLCTVRRSVCVHAKWLCAVVCPQWRSLTQEQQAKYYEQADEEKRLHKQTYPDWTPQDNYVSPPCSHITAAQKHSRCKESLMWWCEICLFLRRAWRGRGRGTGLQAEHKVGQHVCESQLVFMWWCLTTADHIWQD